MAELITDNITSGLTPQYIVPDSFRGYRGLTALQSTRAGGVSDGNFSSLNLGSNTGDMPRNIDENTRRLCAAGGIDQGMLVSSDQVHGTEILYAEKPGRYPGYDAFITDRKNLFLCIYTADCYPVLLYDPRHKASGAAHAGWKGSAGRIVIKTIEAMKRSFNSRPSECLAFIGTGISAEAYEVGREVAGEFPPAYRQRSLHPDEEEKYLLDLGMVNYSQLLEAGVPASNIDRSPFCSFRDRNLFFSYRRDQGKTGRMVSIIGFSEE